MNPTLFLVFVFAALTVFALSKIVSPFLEDRREQLRFELLDEEVQQIERLVARKSVLLQGLRDIEFDHETGKLSEADYERLKAKHERRAVDVMRKLDELRGDDAQLDDEIDSALEERLRRRADQSSRPAAPPVEPAETIDCRECGKQLEAEARFCSRCGTPLDDQKLDRDDHQPEDQSENVETAADNDAQSVSDLRSEATG